MAEPLLVVRGLSKTFPGLKALDSVDLAVEGGEIVALVGHNGSGKSTLVKILAGVHKPDPDSHVQLDSGDAGESSLHFIHQDLGLVGSLTTIENLDLSRSLGRTALLPSPVRHERKHARQVIADFGGDFDVTVPIDHLTAAERTIVAIARALDGWTHHNNVLVLDEPTASLHGDEAEKLFTAVRRVAARGAGVIFISHRLDEVIELADRVIALRDGQVIANVARGEYDHDDLVRMIAGDAAAKHQPDGSREAGVPLLRARGIHGTTIQSLDLDLRAGEIVGISGVLGSGREEVNAILFGAPDGVRAARGEIAELEIGGERIEQVSPRNAITAGVAFVPADRRRDGAAMGLTARENMTLPRLRNLRGRFGSVDRSGERAEVNRWMASVEVRPAEPERPLELFSGGNQQKVLLAKWLRNEPRVLLMDEPTQGVDVGAKAAIFDVIASAAASGAGVLVTSSDAQELALLCDRVIVMRDGSAVAELSGAGLTEAGLVTAALGSRGTPSAH